MTCPRIRTGRAAGAPGLLLALLLGLAGARAHAAADPVQKLLDNATSAADSDPEMTRQLTQAALTTLRTRPGVDQQIQAHLLLCDYYSERDLAAARAQIDAANALLARATRPGLKAGVLTCQGETAEAAGDDALAQSSFDQAVAVARASNEQLLLADALYSRGYLRGGLQGAYAASLTDLRRSLQIYERLGMPKYTPKVLDAVATVYVRIGDYGKAAQIYENALQRQRAANMRRGQAMTLHNLALARTRLGQWDAARAGFTSALTLSREIGYRRGEVYALLGLATIANSTGDPRGALRTLDQVATLQHDIPDVRLQARLQLTRGMALRQLSRWNEAPALLQQAVTGFVRTQSNADLGTAYSELALVESHLGNWRRAYDYRTLSQRISEQLLRNQIDQRFTLLKVEFDSATQAQENALLLRENGINRQALAQDHRTRSLQTAVIVLILLLLGLLTTLVLHQRRGARRMHALAMTDELTRLPNRRCVLTRLEALLQAAEPGPCALMILDIDHFKEINDRHGHPVGDEALRLFAARIRNTLRDGAFAGRLGGEEFAVVLPRASRAGALQLAEQLRLQAMLVDLSHWLGNRRMSVSIGLILSQPGAGVSDMLQRADAALYAAKHAGRNCVRIEPPTDIEPDQGAPWCDSRIA